MRLTKHTDYALRVLLYAAAHDDRLVSTEEIASAYGISASHLVKIINNLGKVGFLEVRRGRSGGLRLARPPVEIRVGDVVRSTEPDFHMVECFDRETNTCPIVGACGLIAPLAEAKRAFLAVLDKYTLADAVGPGHREKTRRLLAILG
ncbi:MAG: Rrf2 family transcriptional regulator [Myxococcales bacterium]|nr:Rrf2 family transcriptional regulator [Myxococcales bacterium]